MVAHHRGVVDGAFPVRDEEGAWQLRRAEYVDWLSSGEGTMLAALPAGDPGAEPLGYAVLLPNPAGATWELGDRVGEIESLAVAPAARDLGVGTALLDAAREHFRAAGIEWWSVAVVEANEGAARLYERAGFGPYYRHLLGRIGPEPDPGLPGGA
ncbi:MAG TPA: GNAT family N-acetyltransferase [Solirubrobacterales bacterium]|jgi:ribosomal protein S18 acetylase RimI-like enzyme